MTHSLKATDLRCIREQTTLFAPVSFQLNPGQALLVEGPNGSGKSSLLRLLAGLATPAEGDVFWKGLSIQNPQSDYTHDLHYLGHTNGIKLGLTITENLDLAHHLAGAKETDYAAILSLLQLNTQRDKPAKFLSAGQKRRLGLAKLFLFPKLIWILDEPLTALDSATQTIFLAKLNSHLQQNGIAILSSHHPITLQNAISLRLSAC